MYIYITNVFILKYYLQKKEETPFFEEKIYKNSKSDISCIVVLLLNR